MGDGVTLVSSRRGDGEGRVPHARGARARAGPRPLGPPTHRFLATGDAASFTTLARRFLGPEVTAVEPAAELRGGDEARWWSGCAGSFPGAESAASCYLVQADDEAGRTWNVAAGPGQRGARSAAAAAGPGGRRRGRRSPTCTRTTWPTCAACTCTCATGLTVPPTGADAVYGPFGTASRVADAYGMEPGEDMSRPARGAHVAARTAGASGPHAADAGAGRTTRCRPTGSGSRGRPRRTRPPPSRSRTRRHRRVHRRWTTLAAGADLLLAEAAFVEGREDAVRGIHLTGRRAGEAAARGGSAALMLTHIPAWNPPRSPRSRPRRSTSGPITTAAPGMVVEL